MVRTLCAAICFAVPTAAISAPIIQCDAKSGESLRIELNAKKKFGVMLNCIEGNIPTEGESCAPSGGFSETVMSSGEIFKIVPRWQEFLDFSGTIYGSVVTSTRISFFGGYRQYNGLWIDHWNFKVDRTTGIGALTLEDKTGVTITKTSRYICKAVTTRF